MSIAATLSVEFEILVQPLPVPAPDCDDPEELPYILNAAVTANANISAYVFVHLQIDPGPPAVNQFCKVATLTPIR